MEIQCLHDGHFKLAEGPVWCPLMQTPWWVNMVEPPAVYRLKWGAAGPDVFPAPQPVTGLAIAADDLVILGTVGGLLRLDPASGAFDPVLRLTDNRPGNRSNELGVDPAGHLWVGTMTDNLSGATVEAGAGALFRVAPDGGQRVMLRGIGIPNTLVWDSTGQLLTADSLTGVIRRVDPAAGDPGATARVLLGPGGPGVPDGSALVGRLPAGPWPRRGRDRPDRLALRQRHLGMLRRPRA